MTKPVAIVDYGVGNLRSLQNAFRKLDVVTCLVRTPREILNADKIVLPGVGAFGYAMRHIEELGLTDALRKRALQSKPLLGICLGMQLLFDWSEEAGGHSGLGILRGRVIRFDIGLKVPHMGWNEVQIRREGALLNKVASGYAYFVHSFHCQPTADTITSASSDYGISFCAAVEEGTTFGTQFHPEKSLDLGLQVLNNFARI